MRDYEDLVKSLRYCAEYDCTTVCPRAGTGNGCITRLKKEAADAIEELSKPKWISVEERLPTEAGEYMVAYHPCCWDIVHFNVTMVGLDSFRGKTTWAKKKYQRVTHWMPLPSTEGLNEA